MLYTIGHSNHSLGAFLALLAPAGVRWLADVRAIPRSRFSPQFDRPALAASLARTGIGYRHLPALGGRRRGHAGVDPAHNAFWGGGAFHAYADHALGQAFATALAQVRALGADGGCALMCAEADWRQCHRQLIADHLLHAGEQVVHLGPRGPEAARLHPAARIDVGGRLHYPPSAGHTGDLFA